MPACFGALGLGAEQAEHHVGLGARWLVQIFWPLSTHSSPSQLGARLERREVAARAGLAVALAPGELAGQRRLDVLAPLLLGAALEQRRHEHVRALDREPVRRAGAVELLADHRLGHRSSGSRPRRRKRAGRCGAGSPRAIARLRHAIACSRAASARLVAARRPAPAQNARTSARSFSYFSPNWRFISYHPSSARDSARGAARASRATARSNIDALEPELDVALPGEADAAVQLDGVARDLAARGR